VQQEPLKDLVSMPVRVPSVDKAVASVDDLSQPVRIIEQMLKYVQDRFVICENTIHHVNETGCFKRCGPFRHQACSPGRNLEMFPD
jgi:hypothetical protein